MTAALLVTIVLLLALVSNVKTLAQLQVERLDGSVEQGNFEDYVAFYAAGELVLEGRGSTLYEIDVVAAKEQEIMGRPVGGTGSLGFFNPPFVAAIFAPLSLLSVGVAGVVLFAINCILVLGVSFALLRLVDITGFPQSLLTGVALLSLNSVFWLIGHGQFSMLLVLGFLGFYWYQIHGKNAYSGLALALVLVKPQVAILAVLVLFVRRDWQALVSFSCVAAVLVLVSIVAAGPEVLWDYPSFVLSSTGWEKEFGINVERMYGWNGLFTTLAPNHSFAHLALTAVASVATAGLVIRAFRHAQPGSGEFNLAFGAMIAAAILVNPHIYLQDMVLIVLVLAFGYQGSRVLGWSAWVWVFSSALVWLAQEMTDRTFEAFSLNLLSLLALGLFVLLLHGNETASRLSRGSRSLPRATQPRAA